jgi:hypothetical protein
MENDLNRFLVFPDSITSEVLFSAEEMGQGVNLSGIEVLEMLGHKIGILPGLSCKELNKLYYGLPRESAIRAKAEVLWDEAAETRLGEISDLESAQSALGEGEFRSRSKTWEKLISLRDNFASEKVRKILSISDSEITEKDLVEARKWINFFHSQQFGDFLVKFAKYSVAEKSRLEDFLFWFIRSGSITTHEDIFAPVFSAWLSECSGTDSLDLMRRKLGDYDEVKYLSPDDSKKRRKYTVMVEEKIIELKMPLIRECRTFKEVSELHSRMPRSEGPKARAFHFVALEKALALAKLSDFRDYGLFGSQGMGEIRDWDSALAYRIISRRQELALEALDSATEVNEVVHIAEYLENDNEIGRERCIQKAVSLIKTAKGAAAFADQHLFGQSEKLKDEIYRLHESLALSEVRAAKTIGQIKQTLEICPQGGDSPAYREALRRIADFYRIPEAEKSKTV